jgi:hypothetical protein
MQQHPSSDADTNEAKNKNNPIEISVINAFFTLTIIHHLFYSDKAIYEGSYLYMFCL